MKLLSITQIKFQLIYYFRVGISYKWFYCAFMLNTRRREEKKIDKKEQFQWINSRFLALNFDYP